MSDDEVGPPSVETGMSYGEIVHQVENSPTRHEGRETFPTFLFSLSFHATSSPGICNLGALSMFHQSQRAGFGGAADVDEMFLGKKEQTTEGGGADGLSFKVP